MKYHAQCGHTCRLCPVEEPALHGCKVCLPNSITIPKMTAASWDWYGASGDTINAHYEAVDVGFRTIAAWTGRT